MTEIFLKSLPGRTGCGKRAKATTGCHCEICTALRLKERMRRKRRPPPHAPKPITVLHWRCWECGRHNDGDGVCTHCGLNRTTGTRKG